MIEMNTYTLALPRDLVQTALRLKPKRSDLSDEAFLACFLARGDFSSYIEELQAATRTVEGIYRKLGLPRDERGYRSTVRPAAAAEGKAALANKPASFAKPSQQPQES